MIKSSKQRLLELLRSEGPQSPAVLMGRLSISQPTLFRLAKAQPENIAALGANRNRKLAALRNARGLTSITPVFFISPEGEAVSAGNLLALYPSSFVFQPNSSPSKPLFYPGLPFFLDDMRPQGFMGRTFSQKHSDLRLPPRISDWSNDDILEALACRGEDLTGNLLIGAESFERYQSLRRGKTEAIDGTRPAKQYLIHAQAAIDGQPAGSSAGGEQPKFGATLKDKNGTLKKVLVKFSPTGDTFSASRWRDLLICESLSLELLRENGIAAAESRLIEAGGRTFLETLRFDRVSAHGRKGTISLSAIENEWIGRGENWSVSAQALARDKKISADDLSTIQTLECFGRLIANTDRHPGNLSFFWQPGEKQVQLAPIYDMLPMLYAPSSGGEDTRKKFSLPSYDHTLLNSWKGALKLAIQYWTRVHEDSRISPEFRIIAKRNLSLLS